MDTWAPLVVGAAGSALVAQLRAIATEVGASVEVVEHPAGERWAAAPLVLVCGDVVQAVADEAWLSLPPRPGGGVILVLAQGGKTPWRAVADIAAEEVAELPGDRAWLGQQPRAGRLTAAADREEPNGG